MTTWRDTSSWHDLVLAFEDSPRSDAALAFAAGLAEQLGATLHVVHVLDLTDYPIDPDLAGSPQETELVERAAARARHEISERLRGFTCSWTYTGETGNPVLRINRAAHRHGAAAIVVGASTPGLAGTLHRSLKGSVLRELVRHARRAVMIVPPESEP
ncbi:universal stress protein [Streptomyces sp. NPDC006296]|uniref:universal stress protein n=1 Tax=Streptomyces sp. NPDC006296 TaxID=3156746 RepID=UPI0033BCD29E